MGTRGAVGFRLNGEDKLCYNHYDSYPDCLGHDVIKWIIAGVDRATYDGFIGETKQRVGIMEAVDENVPPTDQQIAWLKEYYDSTVSTGSIYDWYALLRNTQGNIEDIMNARYFVSSATFLNDSLFCEYAYIVNLDDETLEFYKGFQQDQSKIEGRYKDNFDKDWKPSYPNAEQYFSVTLVHTIPLAEVATSSADELTATLNKMAHPEEADA